MSIAERSTNRPKVLHEESLALSDAGSNNSAASRNRKSDDFLASGHGVLLVLESVVQVLRIAIEGSITGSKGRWRRLVKANLKP